MGTERPEIAVGAVCLQEGKILMVRRRQDPAAGLWTLPGGRVEAGEYLAAAVEREVREETGLDVIVGDLLGVFEVIGDPHFVILDYLAVPADPEATPAAASDVSDAAWIPLDRVEDLDTTPRFLEMMRSWGVLP